MTLLDPVRPYAVVSQRDRDAGADRPPPILTGLGAYRRGLAALPASLAGLFFPIAWIVWYLRDEHPYRHAHRHPF
jgi:hypothetical protein